MDQDSWLADLLTSEPTLSQDGDTLTITNGKTVLVLSDEQVAVPDASLTGSRWNLDSIVHGDAVSSVPEGVTSTVRFFDDGRFTLASGCNTITGRYTVEDDVLRFSHTGTTLMSCNGPEGDVETDVMDVLGGDVRYSIDGTRLAVTSETAKDDSATGLTYRTS
jgi:heat shock protein HslJ